MVMVNSRGCKLLIPHQANFRIINVMKRLNISAEKVVSSQILEMGNAGVTLVYLKLLRILEDLIVISVFGGGYSFGAMLLEK